MRILIAPNSMKGTIDAFDFADAVEEGLTEIGAEVIKLPVADGGDGTAKVLSSIFGADFISCQTTDPLNRIIPAGFYYNEQRLAIIEIADASGLKLLKPSEYSPLDTTSFGAGTLIKSAVLKGASTIVIGLGGSATVDAGMGALMALGVKFYSNEGEIILGNGRNIGEVIFIDYSIAKNLLQNVRIILLSDVNTPLLGPVGAAKTFGPQKGASPSDVNILEKNLALFAGALFQTTGKNCSLLPGGGAAGGIAASLSCLFNVEIREGAAFILEKSDFKSLAMDSDIIITGEGKIDNTSLLGKVTGEILKIGMEIDKPVYAICGSNELIQPCGFENIVSFSELGISEDDSIINTKAYVKSAAAELANKLTAYE